MFSLIPTGAGAGTTMDCGTFLTGVDSIWTIGETANFPGALVDFALIA